MADRIYTARLVTNPGRPGFLVEYRHPGVPDRQGYGKKVTRGLNTRDEAEANAILVDLNAILADKNLHELAARKLARARFCSKAVEVFYGVYEKDRTEASRLERVVPLAQTANSVPVVALLGNTSVGKTTLLRHLMGTDLTSERFPATSGNRTTLFPFEVIVEDGRFRAAVSFRTETEVEQLLQQTCLKAAMKCLDGSGDEVILRELFEPTEEGLRLKYLLGHPKAGGESRIDNLASEWIARIRTIAAAAENSVNAVLRDAAKNTGNESKGVLREFIEDEAEDSPGMGELVSEILEELRERSKLLVQGNVERTATNWPKVWSFEAATNERASFIKEIKRFTGNARDEFGNLVTPLVGEVRISGPFFPTYGEKDPLVLCDTVGFGHYASTAGDLQEEYTALCENSDCILIVESAKTSFSSASLHQALEAATTSGYSHKLVVAFTHMDALEGDDVIDFSEQQEKALLGLRSAIDEHVAKKLSREAARQLTSHLSNNVFFFSNLNQPANNEVQEELLRFRRHLARVKPPTKPVAAFPSYDFAYFVPFVITAIERFRHRWAALLGVRPHSGIDALPWQAPKAISRRYAEGWMDGYPHRPVSSLHAVLRQEIARFLDEPKSWPGAAPSDSVKQVVLDTIKAELSKPLLDLCSLTVRSGAKAQWIAAWEFRGINSTIRRRSAIESIFGQHLPYFRLDNGVSVNFIDTVRRLVEDAIDRARDKLANSHTNEPTITHDDKSAA